MVIAGVFDWLKDFSDSSWLPLIIFVIALLDSVIPVVPSETMVIVGGVAAGSENPQQSLPIIILVAALGAFTGDNLAYQLGRSSEGFLRRTLFRGEKGAKRMLWASEQLDKRGGMLLITARFIPGGRTVVTVMSGATRRPRRWFMTYIAIAAAIWATYAATLGYAGGKQFEDDHTKAFVVAFAMALSVTVMIELMRFALHRRQKNKKPATTP